MKKKKTRYIKRYWTTAIGEEIEYREIENKHLIAILFWIKDRAEKGITVFNGGGFDPDDMWYDEYELQGSEVLKRYDYANLFKEAIRRKIITKKTIK